MYNGPKENQNQGMEDGDFVVGIDTGGTYTDAVLMDYQSRKVITSHKTLTTHEDLSRSITISLKSLEIKDKSRVKQVGISSTLATNAIAQGRTGNVALLLIGYDKKFIEAYKLHTKLPTKNIVYFQGGHTPQGVEQAPLDNKALKNWVKQHGCEVDALAISSYFSPLNPTHEEKAFEIIKNISSLPVVLGHQLSTKIDSIKRAATACLNASLVIVMQNFIRAVKISMAKEGITAPLMIVKGDGTLMSCDIAMQKPVETILSGPAASAIGGRFLSGCNNGVIFDVGGTTTDIALMENGNMKISDNGTKVGAVATAVKAVNFRTACLGCDSRITFAKSNIVIVGPERVIPLSSLAWHHRSVAQEIQALQKKPMLSWRTTDIEYWVMSGNVPLNDQHRFDENQKKLMDLLAGGPRCLTTLLADTGCHHVIQLNADSLIDQGIIKRSTLTPTDLLHSTGDIHLWDADTARIAITRAAEMNQKDPDTIAEEILDQVVCSMAREVIIFLSCHNDTSSLPDKIDDVWGEFFMEQALTKPHSLVPVTISSQLPIIGIGGPAGYFAAKVAERLNTELILPPNAEVANAAGAVAGAISMEEEALIFIKEQDEKMQFVLQIKDFAPEFFEEEAQAVARAIPIIKEQAIEKALSAGAVLPQLTLHETIDASVHRLTARAVGNPNLSMSHTLKIMNN